MATRMTVALDDDVRAQIDTEMRMSRKSFKQVVNETLRIGLQEREKPVACSPPRVQTKNMDLKTRR
jgi:hypothetical protein